VLTDGTLKYVNGLGLAYAVDNAGNVQVFHPDGLGSIRAITDQNQNVFQKFQADEFGVPGLVKDTSTEPFKFTGEQNDGETGFCYLRTRYYTPALGRFLSRDSEYGVRTSPLWLNRYPMFETTQLYSAIHPDATAKNWDIRERAQ
jgi:RHS repeat-associated protein